MPADGSNSSYVHTGTPISPLNALTRVALGPEKRFFSAVMVYAVAVGALSLAAPALVQTLINSAATTALPQSLVSLSVLALGLLLLSALMQALQIYAMERFRRRFFARTSLLLGRTLLNARAEIADQRAKIDRFFEIVNIQKALPTMFVGVFTLFLQMLAGFVVVSLYHPIFGLFTLSVMMCSVLIWVSRHGAAQAGAIKASSARYYVAAELERLAAPPHLPVEEPYAAERAAAFRTLEGKVNAYLDGREAFFSANFTQIVGFLLLYALGSVALLATGGALTLQGKLTLGQLAAAELIFTAIFYGVSRLGYYLTLYYELCAGSLKLDELLRTPSADHPPALPSESASARVTEPSAAGLAAYLTFGGLALTGAAFVYVPWVQTAPGSGSVITLQPSDRAQALHAPFSGRVAKWYVQDGERVEKDAPIVEIEDNDRLLPERLRTERDAARAALEASRQARQTSGLDVIRKQNLFNQGLVSKRDVERARIDESSWRAKEAEAAAKLASAEVELSRRHAQLVRAPRAGRILRAHAADTATLVKSGDILAEFAPDQTGEAAAEIYLSGMDAPLVHSGRRVMVQFEGWPAAPFSGWPGLSIGTFEGEVVSVDPAVSADGRFRALVKPLRDGLGWPSRHFLRLGTRARGWIQLDTVPLGYEFWRQLNGFPPEASKTISWTGENADKKGKGGEDEKGKEGKKDKK